MSSRSLAPFAVIAAALGAGACGPPKLKLVDFSETPRNYRSRDYGSVYDRWTRHAKVMHDLNPAIEVWGTLKSADFREAFVEHYGEIYGVAEAERQKLRASQLDTARGFYEFHLVAQSANFDWVDLEKNTTAWRLSLVDGTGREMMPEKIEIQRLPQAYQDEFFPQSTPFSKTYLIRFPREGTAGASTATGFLGARTGRITLRIAGPFGRADLVWQSS